MLSRNHGHRPPWRSPRQDSALAWGAEGTASREWNCKWGMAASIARLRGVLREAHRARVEMVPRTVTVERSKNTLPTLREIWKNKGVEAVRKIKTSGGWGSLLLSRAGTELSSHHCEYPCAPCGQFLKEPPHSTQILGHCATPPPTHTHFDLYGAGRAKVEVHILTFVQLFEDTVLSRNSWAPGIRLRISIGWNGRFWHLPAKSLVYISYAPPLKYLPLCSPWEAAAQESKQCLRALLFTCPKLLQSHQSVLSKWP